MFTNLMKALRQRTATVSAARKLRDELTSRTITSISLELRQDGRYKIDIIGADWRVSRLFGLMSESGIQVGDIPEYIQKGTILFITPKKTFEIPMIDAVHALGAMKGVTRTFEQEQNTHIYSAA